MTDYRTIIFGKGVDHATTNGNVENSRHDYRHRPGGGRRTVLPLVQPGPIKPDSGQHFAGPRKRLGGSFRRSIHQTKHQQPALPNELRQSGLRYR